MQNDLQQYSGLNLDALSRYFGSTRVQVADFFNVYDLTQTVKSGSGKLITQNGLYFNNTGTTAFSSGGAYSNYSGRLSVFYLEWDETKAINITFTIPAGYADDTTRFRNLFGPSITVATLGVMNNNAQKTRLYTVSQSGLISGYWCLPPGSTISVTGADKATVVFSVLETGQYVLSHAGTGGAIGYISYIVPWDGSYLYGRFSYTGVTGSTASTGTTVGAIFVNVNQVPLFVIPVIASASYSAFPAADLLFSVPVFAMENITVSPNLTPGLSQSEGRNICYTFMGKKITVGNNTGLMGSTKDWLTYALS